MLKSSTSSAALIEAVKRGYTITKDGKVFNPKGKFLRGYINTKGYIMYGLGSGKDKKNFGGHQFQAYTKFGDKIFETDCVRHLNDIPSDNRWDNIEIGSVLDNYNDMPITKRMAAPIASVEVNRVLTDAQCEDVFSLLKQGATQEFIRLKYGLAKSTISDLINKAKYYKEVTKDL